MWAEHDVYGLSKITLCFIFGSSSRLTFCPRGENLLWLFTLLARRRRAALLPESLRKQKCSAWVKKLDQAHPRLSHTEHEDINHTHPHFASCFTHFYRGTFILCYFESGVEFVACSSKLDTWQSAWLGHSPCLVQSCACKSMTECITANHFDCLLERQLSWDDAVMASRQMERKRKMEVKKYVGQK